MAAVVLALSVALASCGGISATHQSTRANRTPVAQFSRPQLEGPTLSSPAPEPRLALRDYLGRRIDISSYRGKAVLVTFLYTHCPDVCPLIAANLHNALAMLGARAAKVRIVAVSTDPVGDTPGSVAAFLAEHRLAGRMEYLIGARAALRPIWLAWGVTASDPTKNDEVNHSALVYGISGTGRVRTVYPANFPPATVAHDVPILASM